MLSAVLSSIVHLYDPRQQEPVACVRCVPLLVITLCFTQVSMLNLQVTAH